MSLGENIKAKRNELKLSQEYVAEQLGVSRQAVSKWKQTKVSLRPKPYRISSNISNQSI